MNITKKTFIISLIIFLTLLGIGVFSATIFEIDFESPTYSIGNLNGQDSWSGGTGYDVTSTIAYYGIQSLAKDQRQGGIDEISRTGTGQTEGTTILYMRDNNFISTYLTDVEFLSGTDICMKIGINGTSNVWQYRDNTGWQTTVDAAAVDTWYKITIEWQETGGSNPQFRFSIDDGAFNGWYDCWNDWGVGGLDKIQFYASPDDVHISFYDYIHETESATSSSESTELNSSFILAIVSLLLLLLGIIDFMRRLFIIKNK